MYLTTMKKIDFGTAISVGNQVNLELRDYLMYLTNDETIKITLMYIKEVEYDEKFVRLLSATLRNHL